MPFGHFVMWVPANLRSQQGMAGSAARTAAAWVAFVITRPCRMFEVDAMVHSNFSFPPQDAADAFDWKQIQWGGLAGFEDASNIFLGVACKSWKGMVPQQLTFVMRCKMHFITWVWPQLSITQLDFLVNCGAVAAPIKTALPGGIRSMRSFSGAGKILFVIRHLAFNPKRNFTSRAVQNVLQLPGFTSAMWGVVHVCLKISYSRIPWEGLCTGMGPSISFSDKS